MIQYKAVARTVRNAYASLFKLIFLVMLSLLPIAFLVPEKFKTVGMIFFYSFWFVVMLRMKLKSMKVREQVNKYKDSAEKLSYSVSLEQSKLLLTHSEDDERIIIPIDTITRIYVHETQSGVGTIESASFGVESPAYTGGGTLIDIHASSELQQLIQSIPNYEYKKFFSKETYPPKKTMLYLALMWVAVIIITGLLTVYIAYRLTQ